MRHRGKATYISSPTGNASDDREQCDVVMYITIVTMKRKKHKLRDGCKEEQ